MDLRLALLFDSSDRLIHSKALYNCIVSAVSADVQLLMLLVMSSSRKSFCLLPLLHASFLLPSSNVRVVIVRKYVRRWFT